MESCQRNNQLDMRHLLTNLHSWGEQSQKEFAALMLHSYAEFSNIINSQGTIMSKNIENLVEEVRKLKEQLSLITQERDDLLETVESLNIKIMHDQEVAPDLGSLESGNPEVADEITFEQNEYSTASNGTEYSEDDVDDVEPIKTPIKNHNKKDASQFEEIIDKNEEINHLKESTESKTNVLETDWKRHTSRSGTGWMCELKVPDPTCRQPDGISCPYTSSLAHHMKEHVEASHLKIRNHFCKECDYSSYRKQTLNKHVKTVHAKTGRYVCQECGHAEHKKMLLMSHMSSVHKMKGLLIHRHIKQLS